MRHSMAAKELDTLLAKAATIGITLSDRSKVGDGKDNKTDPSL